MMYFNVCMYFTRILVLFLSLLYICICYFATLCFRIFKCDKTFVYFYFLFYYFFFACFLLLVYKLHLRKTVACHSMNDRPTDRRAATTRQCKLVQKNFFDILTFYLNWQFKTLNGYSKHKQHVVMCVCVCVCVFVYIYIFICIHMFELVLQYVHLCAVLLE